ncbi:GIY-YIG nuclease family protein [Marivirga sp. S37H4]|uniref:GIY-YIG nuclease family protein n=1 Tax=Marivirga aurantiaca TaxID=2802615 RepID=A0A934WY08_9BACT|nr:exonuclease domain-containing protein [Marivirga aurantiaca]MBK6264901.1 GIY-YIG nuclease family protein [Marivirga aurantiaca]
MYAIVDIETTGGYADNNRICEIAIIIHDGQKVVKEYQSLINPERSIPYGVQAIHGINDAMVADAPKFFEQAKTIYELLKDNIFVAHSVNFDYSFVQKAFVELGFPLQLKKLCTVRLSRKIFPGYKSYSLGNLCDHRKIIINDRHRAYGDAIATAELFTQLLAHDTEGVIEKTLKKNASNVNIPENLNKEVYEALPQAPGVYYFLNSKSQIIYVGKAKDIKKRVSTHFGGNKGEIAKQAFQKDIYHVDYLLTGNELIALLHESHEIRKHWPRFNSAQKNNNPGHCIFLYEDRLGYKRLQIGRKQNGMKTLMRFANHAGAFKFLVDKSKELNICPKMAGYQSSPTECFDHKIKECEGACIGDESPESHNKKIKAFIQLCDSEKSDYIFIGKGKSQEEMSIVMVEGGSYLGYGFLHKEEAISEWEDLKNYLQKFPDHPEIYKILNSETATKGLKKIKKDDWLQQKIRLSQAS